MLGLPCILYFLNSLFSFTFLFLSSFPFQLPILILLGTVFFTPLLTLLSIVEWLMLCPSLILVSVPPLIMGIVPFIPKFNPRWFCFFTLAFHQTFCPLQAFGQYLHRNILAMCRWVQFHYPLTTRSGFSLTTCLTTNFFPLLGKSQSGHNTTISIFHLMANLH